jgi:hypothetical protein
MKDFLLPVVAGQIACSWGAQPCLDRAYRGVRVEWARNSLSLNRMVGVHANIGDEETDGD